MKYDIHEFNSIFWDIVRKYDISDNNILRKIIHSYDVAKICYTTACKRKLNKDERYFCYVLGLFHDVGRFKQWKLYGTYEDAKSIDHGKLSADIVKNMNSQELFGMSDEEVQLLADSINYHTKPYLGNDDKVKYFNQIINNADAYSNVVESANGMHRISSDIEGYNEELLRAFKERELLVKYPPLTKLDKAIKSTACVYYINDQSIREEIIRNNYLDMIYENFSSGLSESESTMYKELIEDLKSTYLEK